MREVKLRVATAVSECRGKGLEEEEEGWSGVLGKAAEPLVSDEIINLETDALKGGEGR
jgi:hypothetical protein